MIFHSRARFDALIFAARKLARPFPRPAERDAISSQISDLFRGGGCIAKLTRLPSQLPLSNERLTIRNDLQLVRLSSSSLVLPKLRRLVVVLP